MMKFKLINSIDPDLGETLSHPGGIGLENVKKRFEILYGGKYDLHTQKLDEVFVVNLNTQLEFLESQYIDKLQLSKTI